MRQLTLSETYGVSGSSFGDAIERLSIIFASGVVGATVGVVSTLAPIQTFGPPMFIATSFSGMVVGCIVGDIAYEYIYSLRKANGHT